MGEKVWETQATGLCPEAIPGGQWFDGWSSCKQKVHRAIDRVLPVKASL